EIAPPPVPSEGAGDTTIPPLPTVIEVPTTTEDTTPELPPPPPGTTTKNPPPKKPKPPQKPPPTTPTPPRPSLSVSGISATSVAGAAPSLSWSVTVTNIGTGDAGASSVAFQFTGGG